MNLKFLVRQFIKMTVQNVVLPLVYKLHKKKNIDEKWIDNISISEAIKRLPEREQNIISLRFFSGKTQMEIADEIGISQAQVSRLEKNAINHMKKYL